MSVAAVDSFREAAPLLRRPFTSAAVKFKVQATWPKDNPTGGLIVAYIDARLAVERLNLVVPDLWHDEYEPLGKDHLICKLTVDGITRQDVGRGEGKALYSDALKRAAVKFGVGVSLYAIPKMIVDARKGHAKPRKDSLELTQLGEGFVRTAYANWLQVHGTQAFGEPLDHGDVEDAQGDAEIEEHPDSTNGFVTAEDVASLKAAAKGLTVAQIREAFTACAIPADFRNVADGFASVSKAKAPLLAEALAGVER